MSDSAGLLTNLMQRGVRLRTDGQRIGYDAPEGRPDTPTLAEIDRCKPELIELLKAQRFAPPVDLPEPDVSRDEYPLSEVQESFWELEQAIPGSIHSNLCRVFRLDGALDRTRFEAAVAQVIARHATLRTGFGAGSLETTQRVVNFCRCPVDFFDLSLQTDGVEDAILAVAAGAFHRPFDLAVPPLLRVTLVQIDTQRHILIIVVHHIICDGWSLNLLVKELFEISSRPALSAISSMPRELRFGDIVIWQRRRLAKGELDAQRCYWRQALARPPGECSSSVKPFHIRTARISMMIDARRYQTICALGRTLGCTPFIVLTALFKLCLAWLEDIRRLQVATIIATRAIAGTESLIGPLLNTLVFCTDLSDDPSLKIWLARVRNVVVGALEHQDIPFSEVAAEWQLRHACTAANLCHAMIIFEPEAASPSATPDFSCNEINMKDLFVSDRTLTSFDVTLTLEEIKGMVKGAITYKTDCYSCESIEEFARHLIFLIDVLQTDPDRLVSTLLRRI